MTCADDAQVAPRAEIFRRDQGSVCSLADMKRLMRYNDYAHDPLSGGQPYASVCARGDLAATGAIPKGGYDSKARWAARRARVLDERPRLRSMGGCTLRLCFCCRAWRVPLKLLAFTGCMLTMLTPATPRPTTTAAAAPVCAGDELPAGAGAGERGRGGADHTGPARV